MALRKQALLSLAMFIATSVGAPTLSGFADVASELTSEDLINGIKSRAERYTQCHVQFKQWVYNEDNPEKILSADKFDLFRNQDRLELTRTSALPTSGFVVQRGAWDGGLRTGYTQRRVGAPDQLFSGTIVPRKDLSMEGKWSEVIDESFIEARTTVAKAVSMGHWDLVGKRPYADSVAFGLKSNGPIGTIRESMELWVAPEFDFCPIELIEILPIPNGKPIVTRLDDVEVARYGDRWVIKKAKVHTNNPNVTPIPQIAEFEQTSYEPTIPENMDFRVKFPVGTHVFDELKQIGFVAGKYAEIRTGNGLMRRVAIKLTPEYDALSDYSTGLTEAQYKKTHWAKVAPATAINPNDFVERVHINGADSRRWQLIVLNCALLLAIVGVVYGRKRWGKKQSSRVGGVL